MNYSFSASLPESFSPASRVWIYQADRTFIGPEKIAIAGLLNNFVNTWRSHGAVVSGFARIIFDRFIVLVADETEATVSGCSTDSSVRLIRDIQQQFSVDLFNRQQLAFIVADEITLFPMPGLSAALKDGRLTPDSLFFNNAVTTLAEMKNDWIISAGKSWLQHRPAFASAAG